MRHRVFGRKLDRDRNHRQALFANLLTGLIQHRRINTTSAKAKAVRGLVDKVITQAKQGTLHARRQLISTLHDSTLVNQLVDEIAPSLASRTSGYTRIIRIGERRGDDASMVKLEFVNADAVTTTQNTKISKPKQKPTKSKRVKAKPILAKTTPQTRIKTPLASKIANVAHRTQSKG